VRQNDPDVPSKIVAGQYVYGTNIGVGAQVADTYDPIQEPWNVPLTVANSGAVQGAVTFYNQSPITLYVAPINIGTIVLLDSLTIQVNFVTAQPTAPFELGSLLTIRNSTAYNGVFNGAGVVECTPSYVVMQRNSEYVESGTATGGDIRLTNTINHPLWE
jgi:hypothetical protein